MVLERQYASNLSASLRGDVQLALLMDYIKKIDSNVVANHEDLIIKKVTSALDLHIEQQSTCSPLSHQP